MRALAHINPDSMHRSPAFTHAVRVPAGSDTIYVGGQNGTGPDGNVVGPSTESFMAAAAGAIWDASQGFGTLLNHQPGANSWPMAGATFILVYKQPENPAATAEALKFFKWAYENGDDMASSLHFVPLPAELTQQIQETWRHVEGWAG